jgi:hypothetical protein
VRRLEERTAVALGEPDKTLLREWRCPKCGKPFAWLWSTSAGRVLRVVVPPRMIPTREQMARAQSEWAATPGPKAPKLYLGGAGVCAEFVDEITETSVVALCGKCGPKPLDISNLNVR